MHADSKDGEDLSFTTAGDVASGWLPDADPGQPEQLEPDRAEPEPEPQPEPEAETDSPAPSQQQGPQSLEEDLDSHDRDMELLRQGNPEEVVLRMVQRMGSHMLNRSFEETVAQVRAVFTCHQM